MARTLVIGLDSVDWKFMEKAIERGLMPNSERIYEGGFHGNLRSIDPPLSVPAWLSFATGKRPDKLDVYNFRVPESGTYNIDNMPDYSRFQQDAFWSELEDFGVIGMPSIYPTEDLNLSGFIYSGPFVPEKSNDEYLESRAEKFDYTPDGPNIWRFERNMRHIEKEGNFMEGALEEMEPNFFIGVTSVTDRVQHGYCNDEQKMEELYRKADDFVGKLIDNFSEEDNIFVVSDHGFSEIEKVFYVNTWLEEKGMLKFNDQGDSTSQFKEDLRYKLKNIGKDILTSLGLLDLTMEVIPRDIQNHIRAKRDVWDKIDWNNTKAFATGGYVGQIYINTQEYPEGPVPEEEYDEVRDEIIEKLKQLEDPETGEKVVDQVWMKEEIYREELADRAPDIMFYPKDMAYKVNDGFHGKVFDESVPNGSHGLNGVILGRGPDIREGAEIDMHLTDVAPTLLHLMGEEVPEDMDGEVRKEIFKEGSEPKEREVEYTSKELDGLDF